MTMSRIFIALLAAAMTFAPLAEASAQSRGRDRDDRSEQSQQRRPDAQPERPRVSPDQARREAEASSGGRRLDVRVRPDGNYGVIMENGGRVKEVVVDGQTGRVREPN